MNEQRARATISMDVIGTVSGDAEYFTIDNVDKSKCSTAAVTQMASKLGLKVEAGPEFINTGGKAHPEKAQMAIIATTLGTNKIGNELMNAVIGADRMVQTPSGHRRRVGSRKRVRPRRAPGGGGRTAGDTPTVPSVCGGRGDALLVVDVLDGDDGRVRGAADGAGRGRHEEASEDDEEKHREMVATGVGGVAECRR